MGRNVSDIILFDKDKKILLQHRAEDAHRLPGYWGFFGGGIEEGETQEEAVRRETLEELNYELQNPILILKHSYTWKEDHNTQYIFVEAYDPKQKLNLIEGQNFGWFDLSEVKNLKMIDHDLDVIDMIRGKY